MRFEKHQWSSKSLRMALARQFLIGSHEWVTEHDQPLILNHGKVFYLLADDSGEIIAMFSLKGKSFGDAHTVKDKRNDGSMDALLNHFQDEIEQGTHATSRNAAMVHLLEKHGFTKQGMRGRFTYLVKTN